MIRESCGQQTNAKVIHHELMHALGYHHLRPRTGQNSVMVRASPIAGDDYYSTGDIIRIQERYCHRSLERVNMDYKAILQCQSTFFNGTRLNFYDRFCDGTADCEGGEDEESAPNDHVKLVHSNELYNIETLHTAWAIKFEVKPTGINMDSETNVFYFTQRESNFLQPLPGVFVRKGTTEYSICFYIVDELICYDEELPLNEWTKIVIGQVPEINYPYPYHYKVYINEQLKFDHKNPEPKLYNDVIGYFSAPLESYQLAIAELRTFVHSATLIQVGINYTWNCTEHGPDFGDGNQCIGIDCGLGF